MVLKVKSNIQYLTASPKAYVIQPTMKMFQIILHSLFQVTKKTSGNNLALTQKLKYTCENFEIQILDHIIVTNDGYCSFADEGML